MRAEHIGLLKERVDDGSEDVNISRMYADAIKSNLHAWMYADAASVSNIRVFENLAKSYLSEVPKSQSQKRTPIPNPKTR